jgi:hypothetical protein
MMKVRAPAWSLGAIAILAMIAVAAKADARGDPFRD